MRSKSLITINEPNSLATESYKMFRTNLNYVNVDSDIQVIMFTSSTSEEGKTTSSCNTAISLAQAGEKVLLVECDLRKARVHTIMGLPQSPGLTNLIARNNDFDKSVQAIEEIPGLDVLTAGGPFPPAPAELLHSKMIENVIEEARGKYDKIVIDAPPILHVTDAGILSRLVDGGVILVVASNESKKQSIVHAKKKPLTESMPRFLASC